MTTAAIGEQQRAVLTETISEGLEQAGEKYDFEMLLDALKEKGSSAVALANKISRNDRLFQAAHKLFFKPAETEVREYAKLLEQSTGDVDSLSRVGYELVRQQEKMKGEKERWTDEHCEMVSARLTRIRGAVQELFSEWLPSQVCTSMEQMGTFRDKMVKYTAGNLRNMNLHDLAKAVESHAHHIINNIKELHGISYSIDAARSFLASHTPTSKTPISDLAEWTTGAEKVKEDLAKAKNQKKVKIDVPEIDGFIEKLNDFNAACEKQETAHWEIHTDLIERPFLTIEEINEIHDKVREVLPIYAGQSPEFEDLKKLEGRLEMFRGDAAAWNDLNLSEDELEKMVSRRVEAVSAKESADELLPEWRSAAEIYGNMLAGLKGQRKERSAEWMEMAFRSTTDPEKLSSDECRRRLSEMASVPAYVTKADREKLASLQKALENRLSALWMTENYQPAESIEKMAPERCQKLLTVSAALPEYLTAEDREKIAEIRKHAEKRLDDLEVEGLLVRYRELSFELQKAFLRVAVKEFKELQDGRAGDVLSGAAGGNPD